MQEHTDILFTKKDPEIINQFQATINKKYAIKFQKSDQSLKVSEVFDDHAIEESHSEISAELTSDTATITLRSPNPKKVRLECRLVDSHLVWEKVEETTDKLFDDESTLDTANLTTLSSKGESEDEKEPIENLPKNNLTFCSNGSANAKEDQKEISW